MPVPVPVLWLCCAVLRQAAPAWAIDTQPQKPIEAAEAASRRPRVPGSKKPIETDPHRLQQRQKKIDYGYNTMGYSRYLE